MDLNSHQIDVLIGLSIFATWIITASARLGYLLSRHRNGFRIVLDKDRYYVERAEVNVLAAIMFLHSSVDWRRVEFLTGNGLVSRFTSKESAEKEIKAALTPATRAEVVGEYY